MATVLQTDKEPTVINIGSSTITETADPCLHCEENATSKEAGTTTTELATSSNGWNLGQTPVPAGDQMTRSASSEASIGTMKTLSCHKQSVSHDFRLQLYILLGIVALFILWAALYFPLSHFST